MPLFLARLARQSIQGVGSVGLSVGVRTVGYNDGGRRESVMTVANDVEEMSHRAQGALSLRF